MEHTMPVRPAHLVLVIVGVTAGAVLAAQPPLTPTPSPAPGYTTVMVANPVQAIQQGAWTMKTTQEGIWTVRLSDQPVRTVSEDRVVSFIKPQQSYVFSWPGESALTGQYTVMELGPDGWVRASTTSGTRRRELWINTRQIAAVEAIR
jgi:hypothetical protein